MDYKSAREDVLCLFERKREASQSQVRAMEAGELGYQGNEDYREAYWTYDAEADGENGINAVSPYKGYNKGYGGKGKGRNKGNFHTKGWFQQVYSKGWGNQDVNSSSDNKGWSLSESKGKGQGFQGECYSCGEWGHSAARCPHAWGSWGSAVSDKGKGKGYSHVAELEVSSGAQHGEDHMSMRDGELAAWSARRRARAIAGGSASCGPSAPTTGTPRWRQTSRRTMGRRRTKYCPPLDRSPRWRRTSRRTMGRRRTSCSPPLGRSSWARRTPRSWRRMELTQLPVVGIASMPTKSPE